MTPLQLFATELDTQLKTLHHITLMTHCRPDGDAVGSLEGMRGLLQVNYPHLTVEVVVPPEDIDTHIAWILGEISPTLPAKTDLVLLLDTALSSRTNLPPEIFTDYTVLCIDHHEAFVNGYPGFRDSTAPSATIILTEIAQYLHWQIDAQTATALLLGIYTDTGGFIHRNTNARALSTAAYLLTLGGNHAAIAQNAFGNNSLQYLHQLGKGLQDITIVDTIAILCLPPDIEGGLKTEIIGYLSGIEHIDIACVLLPEVDNIRGSLRTRHDTVDVNALAQKFGGGGHKKAAGFCLPGHIVDGNIVLQDQTYSVTAFAELLGKGEGILPNQTCYSTSGEACSGGE